MLPSVAAVLEDDDLLPKILLCLPPRSHRPSPAPPPSAKAGAASPPTQPSPAASASTTAATLPSSAASSVITTGSASNLLWTPPNRLPEDRFPFPIDAGKFRFLGCRHGFLLILRTSQGDLELLVWDPVNGHEHPVAIPPGFSGNTQINGAVLRVALGDINHFQVALVGTNVERRVMACVYLSETCGWGNLISTLLPPNASNHSLGGIDPMKPPVLVGDSLYILLLGKSSGIIEFDVGRQRLAVIPLPLDSEFSCYYSVMRAEGGGLGFLFLSTSDGSAQLWKWKTNRDGVASWVLGRTIELHLLLFSPELKKPGGLQIQGIAEENNVVFLWSSIGVFMVQLDSLQFKKLPRNNVIRWYPFEGVYAAGI